MATAVDKKKTNKTKNNSMQKKESFITKDSTTKEKVYSLKELAGVFGLDPMTLRAYFNMSQLDYDKKISIQKARELFKKI